MALIRACLSGRGAGGIGAPALPVDAGAGGCPRLRASQGRGFVEDPREAEEHLLPRSTEWAMTAPVRLSATPTLPATSAPSTATKVRAGVGGQPLWPVGGVDQYHLDRGAPQGMGSRPLSSRLRTPRPLAQRGCRSPPPCGSRTRPRRRVVHRARSQVVGLGVGRRIRTSATTVRDWRLRPRPPARRVLSSVRRGRVATCRRRRPGRRRHTTRPRAVAFAGPDATAVEGGGCCRSLNPAATSASSGVS